jgi:transcriptional regulator with XRE-family HTH domain
VYYIDNKGTVYGPYNAKEDGSPYEGEVIRTARLSLGLTQEQLGEKLGVERLQVSLMENHNQVPQSLERRRTIAKVLKIPPILLGVGVIGSYLVPLEEAHSYTVVTPHNVQEANDYLNTAWDACTFIGYSGILPNVRRWKARIEEDAVQRGRNLELLHRYEHFLLVVGRERTNYNGTNPIGLIKVAEQIDDPNARGISLYQRGKLYFQQHKYEDALRDIREALSEVENAGPQVKGLALVGSGPVLAHYATDKADVREVLSLLDKAEKCIEPAKGYPDPFRTRFDESWYYVLRASSMISLLRLEPTLIGEVFASLGTAQEKTDLKYMRRRANIEVFYSEAAFHSGDYASAVSTALEALELARSVDSEWSIERLQNLYSKLAQTKTKDSAELRKLRVALLKK